MSIKLADIHLNGQLAIDTGMVYHWTTSVVSTAYNSEIKGGGKVA